MNIIFYDNDCGLCRKCIQFVLKHDRDKQFYYAPLGGETAKKRLGVWRDQHPEVDSLVLIEEECAPRFYSAAVFRILWLLGMPWASVGWLAFLPAWLLFPFDLGYQLVAALRKRVCPLKDFNQMFADESDRLLP